MKDPGHPGVVLKSAWFKTGSWRSWFQPKSFWGVKTVALSFSLRLFPLAGFHPNISQMKIQLCFALLQDLFEAFRGRWSVYIRFSVGVAQIFSETQQFFSSRLRACDWVGQSVKLHLVTRGGRHNAGNELKQMCWIKWSLWYHIFLCWQSDCCRSYLTGPFTFLGMQNFCNRRVFPPSTPLSLLFYGDDFFIG